MENSTQGQLPERGKIISENKHSYFFAYHFTWDISSIFVILRFELLTTCFFFQFPISKFKKCPVIRSEWSNKEFGIIKELGIRETM